MKELLLILVLLTLLSCASVKNDQEELELTAIELSDDSESNITKEFPRMVVEPLDSGETIKVLDFIKASQILPEFSESTTCLMAMQDIRERGIAILKTDTESFVVQPDITGVKATYYFKGSRCLKLL